VPIHLLFNFRLSSHSRRTSHPTSDLYRNVISHVKSLVSNFDALGTHLIYVGEVRLGCGLIATRPDIVGYALLLPHLVVNAPSLTKSLPDLSRDKLITTIRCIFYRHQPTNSWFNISSTTTACSDSSSFLNHLDTKTSGENSWDDTR
jgi:hypothetical protein